MRRNPVNPPADAFKIFGWYLILSRKQQSRFWRLLLQHELGDEQSAGYKALGLHQLQLLDHLKSLRSRIESLEKEKNSAADLAASLRGMLDEVVANRQLKRPRNIKRRAIGYELDQLKSKMSWTELPAYVREHHPEWLDKCRDPNPASRGVLEIRVETSAEQNILARFEQSVSKASRPGTAEVGGDQKCGVGRIAMWSSSGSGHRRSRIRLLAASSVSCRSL